ncbi:MAG: tRNA uridine-5-carboxymethylaminomethyl(34) synthesis GTPase MnmE, partial [Bdellovibrionales bacterium]|nr:tRNA uridine-5-carboxymethylaminomethyl(34) synthesis GTPase MnmE [Bdellovibrionales bacterium]
SLFAFGITPAEPGEFTKRAFMNGKLDLIQAEAIGELITATSEASLRVASDNLAGKLSTFIDKVAEPLRDTLAEIEASLDFPEEDIEPAKHTALKNRILEAQSSLSNLLPTFQFGLRMREGFKVLLCGPPNAGKSSLLNALLGRDRAIVTEISGTTRDLIEEECIIGNHRFVLCDSAGITETHDVVERLGVELSLERIHWADLVLLIIDGAEEYSNIDELTKLIGEKTSNVWMVTNKVDLNPKSIGKYFCDGSICHQNFYLSVKTGDGLQGLKQALIEEVDNSKSDASHSSVILTQTRQAHLVESALHSLGEALSHLDPQTPLEIVSEDLRVALHTLEEMVGKTYTDDILGRIFSKFCIGK